MADHLLVGEVRLVGIVGQLPFLVEGHLSVSCKLLRELVERHDSSDSRQKNGDNLVELRLASRVSEADGVVEKKIVYFPRLAHQVVETFLEFVKEASNVVGIISQC